MPSAKALGKTNPYHAIPYDGNDSIDYSEVEHASDVDHANHNDNDRENEYEAGLRQPEVGDLRERQFCVRLSFSLLLVTSLLAALSLGGREHFRRSHRNDTTTATNESEDIFNGMRGKETDTAHKKSTFVRPPGYDNSDEEPRDAIDYFVPLTPEERHQLKTRLRSTVLLTKLPSSHDGGSPSPVAPQRTLVLDPNSPKQFMHMHHMKTGGTSIDSLIDCALARQKDLNHGQPLNHASLSECGRGVEKCMDDLASRINATVVDNVFFWNQGNLNDKEAQFDPADEKLDIPVDDMNICSTSDSSVMSFCASLHSVRTFGWKDVDKITVIRNPVDRAWSMYRFTLTRCYNCQPMHEVLEKVANGTFISRKRQSTPKDNEGQKEEEVNYVYSPNDSCAVQMIGHQATNLLSSIELYNVANDVRFPKEKEIVEEAVRNLREQFTWIGLTDRLEESVDAFREVFPFLAENLTETALQFEREVKSRGDDLPDYGFSFPEGYVDDHGCPLWHRNAGRDPTCGTTEMDNYTISLIKKLNRRDIAIYKAAVERFELQTEVLNEFKSIR